MSTKKRKAPASSAAAAAPAPAPVAPSTPGKKWRCDVCLEALYDTFEEAVAHEKICEAGKEATGGTKKKAKPSAAATKKAKAKAPAKSPGRAKGGGGGDKKSPAAKKGASTKEAPKSTRQQSAKSKSLPHPQFAKGAVVDVQSRTWPGINEQGGVAHVLAVRPASESEDGVTRYDVKYLLDNRKEKMVEERWVKDYTPEYSPEKKRGGRGNRGAARGDSAKESAANKKSASTKDAPKNDQPPTDAPNAATKGFHTQWQCSGCGEEAVFDSYDEAVAHERTCLAMKGKGKGTGPQDSSKAEKGNAAATKAKGSGSKKKKTAPAVKKAKGGTKKATGGEGKGTKSPAKAKATEDSPKKKAGEVADDGATPGDKRKTNWRCDVCLEAVFETYEEALAHEKACTARGRKKRPKKVTAEKEEKTQTKAAGKGKAAMEPALNPPQKKEGAQTRSKKTAETGGKAAEKGKPEPTLKPPQKEKAKKGQSKGAKKAKPGPPVAIKKWDIVMVKGRRALITEVYPPKSARDSANYDISYIGAEDGEKGVNGRLVFTTDGRKTQAASKTAKPPMKRPEKKAAGEKETQQLSPPKIKQSPPKQAVRPTVGRTPHPREGTKGAPHNQGGSPDSLEPSPTSAFTTVPRREDVVDAKTQQTQPGAKSRSSLWTILLMTTPLILLASQGLNMGEMYLRERLSAILFLPTVATATLAVTLLIVVACSSFAFATIVTHEGTHHHQSRGVLTELWIAVQDTFRRRPAVAEDGGEVTPAPTLREFLADPDGYHLAFAPAFFGFFAYFGALAAVEEGTGGGLVPTLHCNFIREDEEENAVECGLRSAAGASAGAMAAVMLSAGIQPRDAFEFASTFTWGMVSDPPGLGGYVKGNNFEQCMREFISEKARISRLKPRDGQDNSSIPFQLDEALVPVAVSGFDLMRMRGVNLTSGCMAKAARASAGFPGLFQPVAWRKEYPFSRISLPQKRLPDSLLIDGGISDGLGLNGLGSFSSFTDKKRVINMVVGDYGFGGPPRIKDLPAGVNAESLVSIAIVGTPMCGPWAMKNGPRAYESARLAMMAALDTPMERVGGADGQFVLRVDASQWLDSKLD